MQRILQSEIRPTSASAELSQFFGFPFELCWIGYLRVELICCRRRCQAEPALCGSVFLLTSAFFCRCDCLTLFCVRTMPVPRHGRSASSKQRERSVALSVLQTLRQNRRPISDEPRIHQEPCDESCESWWIIRRLSCQTALQEQMFVSFAEATKTVLSVASKNARG